MEKNKKVIKGHVKKGYAKIAKQKTSCCPLSLCCGNASLTQNISEDSP